MATKTEMLSGRVTKEQKEQVTKLGVSISDAIQAALDEKTKDPSNTTTLVFKEGKYGIFLMANNWIVSKVIDASESHVEARGKEIVSNGSQSYHPSLHQALTKLSNKLLEDKLKRACKDKPLELKELAQMIRDHHDYFVGLVKGM